MQTIAIANQKGGVGKTTTALCLADTLKHIGYNVLYIDVDPQGNSTSHYQAVTENEYTIYDIFNKECTAQQAIQHTDIGDIIPGDGLISEIETKVITSLGGHNILKNSLNKISDEYDFCIIDTPPNLGVYMLNALIAADTVIIPVKAEKYAIDGLQKLLDTINDVLAEANPSLSIAGVLLTAYDRRNELDRKLWNTLPEVGESIGMRVFKTPVRICQDIKKSQDRMVSLIDEYPNTNGAVDYIKVTKELLEGIEKSEKEKL